MATLNHRNDEFAYSHQAATRCAKALRCTLLIVGALIFSAYSLWHAIHSGFESEVFAPFRYEALLIAHNALAHGNAAYFLLHDWSTSPDPAEHPLLYFHNLDVAQLAAGLLQCALGERVGMIALFVISLMITFIGIGLGLRAALALAPKRSGWTQVAIIVVGLSILLVHDRSLRLAPENFLIASTSAITLWHFFLMLRMIAGTVSIWRFRIELAAALVLASLIETNLALLLLMISTILAAVNIVLATDRRSAAHSAIMSLGLAAVALALPRLIQLAAVYHYGELPNFAWDFAFTHTLKTSATVDAAAAVQAYRDHGIAYFGDARMQSYTGNLRAMLGSLWVGSGKWGGVVVVALSAYKAAQLLSSRKMLSRASISTRAALYTLAFLAASIAMIAFSGDALLKVSYWPSGFLDYKLGYVMALVLFSFNAVTTPEAIHVGLKPPAQYSLKIVTAVAGLFVWWAATVGDSSHHDRLDFLAAQQALGPGSYVISNYEPAIVARLFGRPVEMSWFASAQTPEELVAAPLLLRMYRSVHADIGCLHYLFLADYPPYATGGWRFVMSRHGILQSDGSLRPDVDEIFHSADYRLFRLPSARGACGDAITRP